MESCMLTSNPAMLKKDSVADYNNSQSQSFFDIFQVEKWWSRGVISSFINRAVKVAATNLSGVWALVTSLSGGHGLGCSSSAEKNNHLGCIKPYKLMGINYLSLNWWVCRIFFAIKKVTHDWTATEIRDTSGDFFGGTDWNQKKYWTWLQHQKMAAPHGLFGIHGSFFSSRCNSLLINCECIWITKQCKMPSWWFPWLCRQLTGLPFIAVALGFESCKWWWKHYLQRVFFFSGGGGVRLA